MTRREPPTPAEQRAIDQQVLRVMVGLAAERVLVGGGDEIMEMPYSLKADIPGLERRKIKAIDLVRHVVSVYETSVTPPGSTA